MFTFLSKMAMAVCLLYLCFSQDAYSQEICGKWKCSKEMFDVWGLRYATMRGKVIFKKNKTFKVVVKGRHQMDQLRNIYIKLTGIYALKNDSILMYVKPESIKCYADPGVDDPRFTKRYEEWLESGRGTWDAAGTLYEGYVTETDFHEQAVWNKMFGIWNNKYRIARIYKNHLRLGKEIILEQ